MLTIGNLVATYEWWRSTKYFRSLPPADDVRFVILRTKDFYGDFYLDGSQPVIRVSQTKNRHLQTIFATTGHEMLHFKHHLNGMEPTHGALFKKQAKRICADYGFDVGAF